MCLNGLVGSVSKAVEEPGPLPILEHHAEKRRRYSSGLFVAQEQGHNVQRAFQRDAKALDVGSHCFGNISGPLPNMSGPKTGSRWPLARNKPVARRSRRSSAEWCAAAGTTSKTRAVHFRSLSKLPCERFILLRCRTSRSKKRALVLKNSRNEHGSHHLS